MFLRFLSFDICGLFSSKSHTNRNFLLNSTYLEIQKFAHFIHRNYNPPLSWLGSDRGPGFSELITRQNAGKLCYISCLAINLSVWLLLGKHFIRHSLMVITPRPKIVQCQNVGTQNYLYTKLLLLPINTISAELFFNRTSHSICLGI